MPRLRPWRWIKRRYFDTRILMRYGTFFPDTVFLVDGRHRVSINPRDPRARKKVCADAIRGKRRRNQVFWRTAVREFKPGLAVDIGVNFGECLFQADYLPGTRAIGIDGNPDLLPYLRRSRDMHPQAEQIEVHNALVSEQPGQPQSFFVSTTASGGSTAVADVASMRGTPFTEVRVPVTSIDELVGDNTPRTVVFKIDVEGYEGHVLRGMKNITAESELVVGFIEFDTRMLTRARENLPELWVFLTQTFDVSMFVDRQLIDLSAQPWSEAERWIQSVGEHTDLLLLGGPERDRGRDFAARLFGLRRAAA